MSGDSKGLVPQPPEMRMSDADRDKVADGLRSALDEGRLTLEEYDQRLAGVLAARTLSEVEPYVADLPAVVPTSKPAREFAELRTTAAGLKRRGRWSVPRRLLVTARAGGVRLDFTDAELPARVIDIELNVTAGSTTIVIPHGATADFEDVEFVACNGKAKHHIDATPGDGPHFVLHGKQRAGSLTVRHQRRFLGRRW